MSIGTPKEHLICIPLDDVDFKEQCDKIELAKYIKEKIIDDNLYFVFIDEIQFCDGFEEVLNGLSRKRNN